eukprot:scaffold143776_cov40-Attheya_sp.AAC.1
MHADLRTMIETHNFSFIVHASHCIFIAFIAIGVAASCWASLSESPLASMFVAGSSAGGGYCLRSARVRGKMQVARGLGLEVCWTAWTGVFAIVVQWGYIGGPEGQRRSCGEDIQ